MTGVWSLKLLLFIGIFLFLISLEALFAIRGSVIRRTTKYKAYMNKRDRKKLYRKKVLRVQKYVRPLAIPYGRYLMEKFTFIRHEAVVVIIAKFDKKSERHMVKHGDIWFLHKGSAFGLKKGGDTVVCHISQMTSPYWKPEGPVYSAKKNVYIPQLREKGGKRYSLFTGIFWTGAGNCIFAANRMIEFARDING